MNQVKLCVAVLFAVLAGAAQAVTGLKLISSPGDFIGQGQTLTFRARQATVTGFGQPGHASVTVTEGNSSWNLDFAAPSGTALVAASYPAAARYPFQSPLGPGMSVSGESRGCNQLKGWFRVHEYAVDAAGVVTRLAIDFMQNCEILMPPLYGSVRINSRVPLDVPTLQAIAGPDFAVFAGQAGSLDGTQSFSRRRGRPSYQWSQIDGPATALSNPAAVSPTFIAPAVGDENATLRFRLEVSDASGNSSSDDVVVLVKSPTAPTTLVRFNGDAGDYITGGQSYSYDTGNALIRFARNFGNGIDVSIDGATWWTISTAAPNAGAFTAGTYSDAQRYPFQDPGRPGLSLSGDGRGCNTLTGQFTVHQVQFDSSGTPQLLDLSFEQHCEGGGPAAYGQVLLNAVPHATLAPQLRAARKRYGVRE